MSNKINFTKDELDGLPLPAAGQRATYHDHGGAKSVNGLQIRVTSRGVKTFSVFKRAAGGAPERVTLGKYPDITIDQARKKALAAINKLAQGESPSESKRESKAKGMTVSEAFARYIEKKERDDDLPLKARTRSDYAAMIKPGRPTAAGGHTKGGCLATLASKPIRALTASDIRAVHEESLKTHGQRPTYYALQTLKAVLRYFGITPKGDPFNISKATPEAERVRIKKAGVAPREPIKRLSSRLGEFWQALPDTAVGDYLRFLLLTGCRPGEPLKIRVGDLIDEAITIADTKNRSDHTIYLSTQALAVVERQAEGKTPGDLLFNVKPAQANALAHELAARLSIEFVPKLLRAVFASVAERLVTFGVLKGLMNHKVKADLLNVNYIAKTEEELRAGWQAVADDIAP